MIERMTALVCPRCGGSLDRLEPQAESVKCSYCGSVVRLAPPATIRHTARPFPPDRRWLFGLLALLPLVAVAAYYLHLEKRKPRPSPNGLLRRVHEFGGEGVGAGEFTDLRGFSAGGGLIFTQERQGRVQALDLTGKSAGSWILPGGFSYHGFVASSDGSVYKPYDGNLLRRFEGKTGQPLGEFNAKDFDLGYWRFLAPGPSGTIFAAGDNTAIQLDPNEGGRTRMRSSYRLPFKSTGGLTHFAANALGEVYLADLSGHDIVRISPDGQIKGRFAITKLEGLTPVPMATVILPVSGRLVIATALGLELYDPDGRQLDTLFGTTSNNLAAPDERHAAAWINYGSRIVVYEVKK